jgi:hypothetical protein|tara:strand:- start:192 stop:455 length:264 start_codon:yes stop_codon:yes gene_type:complete
VGRLHIVWENSLSPASIPTRDFQGVQQVEVPFEIAAEYVPADNTNSTDKLVQLVGLDAAVAAGLTQPSIYVGCSESAPKLYLYEQTL